MSQPRPTPPRAEGQVKTALQHLNALADARKREKYPNAPYPVRANYTDRTANDLTGCIVDFVNLSGHFASRLASTGQYRDDLKKWIPSQQRAGMPDVLILLQGGVYVGCEVKINDRLSTVQVETHKALAAVGAIVIVVRNFQQFYDFYTEFTRAPFA